MNVFVIGFMGSGKSKIGKKMAKSMDRPFVDLDAEIEKREGQCISDIFKQKGESYFRQIEQKVLYEFYADKNLVVSLGGGACCNQSSWKFIEENGLIIYLKESLDIIYGRLKDGRKSRPLITAKSDSELRSYIESKLEERKKYYEMAHFIYEKEKSSYGFLINQVEGYFK